VTVALFGGASACSGGQDDPSAALTTASSSAGASASDSGSEGSDNQAPGSESGTDCASAEPETSSSSSGAPSSGAPSTQDRDVDRLLVAADVPGSTQQSPPGRVRGESRHVATVTLTCDAAPDAAPAYRTDDAFVSVMNTGSGLVTSGLRVFGSVAVAADFMAEWQRRLEACAGEDFVPQPSPVGEGYGADSFAADSSSTGLGQSLDFYVRDGLRVAELHLVLTDFSEAQLSALVARAAEKFLD
jgi:hypothetical protein